VYYIESVFDLLDAEANNRSSTHSASYSIHPTVQSGRRWKKKKETTSSSSSSFKSTASRFITADCEGQKRECSDPLRLQTKHTKMKKKKEVVSPFGPIHFQAPAAAAVFIVDAVIQIRGVLDYGVEEPTNTDPFPAVNEI
jgi:hypothetical protein